MDSAYLVGSLGFLGEYTPRLDDKGRLILPARFRPAFTGGLVMTTGQERCLYLYTVDEFARRLQALRAGSYSTRQMRDYSRMFLASASEEMPDKQGRVSIPAPLRAYANLSRDVAVIGVGAHAEIWDGPTWNDYRNQSLEAYSNSSVDVFDPATS